MLVKSYGAAVQGINATTITIDKSRGIKIGCALIANGKMRTNHSAGDFAHGLNRPYKTHLIGYKSSPIPIALAAIKIRLCFIENQRRGDTKFRSPKYS